MEEEVRGQEQVAEVSAPVDEVARLQGEVAGAVAALTGLLRARPDVVPELVQGETVAEVEASVVVAQQAYERIAAQAGTAASIGVQVLAGGGVRRSGPGVEGEMGAVEKIAFGFRLRERS